MWWLDRLRNGQYQGAENEPLADIGIVVLLGLMLELYVFEGCTLQDRYKVCDRTLSPVALFSF